MSITQDFIGKYHSKIVNERLWMDIYSINPIFKIIIDMEEYFRCLSYRLFAIRKTYIFDWEDIYRINPIFDFLIEIYLRVYYFPHNVRDELYDSVYRPIKKFIQRGKRGWSDEDVWSIDNYLSPVIYDMLLRLKETKSGTPATRNPNTGEYEFDDERWKEILDKMIKAFKLNTELAKGERDHFSPEMDKAMPGRYNGLSQKEEMDRRIGMFLFVNYYESLWD